jgi:hypothetical protein
MHACKEKTISEEEIAKNQWEWVWSYEEGKTQWSVNKHNVNKFGHVNRKENSVVGQLASTQVLREICLYLLLPWDAHPLRLRFSAWISKHTEINLINKRPKTKIWILCSFKKLITCTMSIRGYDEQRVKNASYLSDPARSTKFSRPNRIFISAFCCHCIENIEQADGHFALML